MQAKLKESYESQYQKADKINNFGSLNQTEVWKKKGDISREKGYYMNNYDIFDTKDLNKDNQTSDFILAFELNKQNNDDNNINVLKKVECIYTECQHKSFSYIKDMFDKSKSTLFKFREYLQQKKFIPIYDGQKFYLNAKEGINLQSNMFPIHCSDDNN